jgi:inhibitor of cysteine peptidase
MRLLNRLIVIALLFCSVASYAEPVSTNKAPIAYTEDHLNITVNADNPQFTIELGSNPTTGYSWFLREYDDKILTPVKHSYIPAKNKLLGASGVEVWTFRVKPDVFIVPQQSTLRFIYTRPWQNDDQPKLIIFKVTTLR